MSNSRWLSTTKARLGKLFFHGCHTEETMAAGALLARVAQNWREYVAGSEGFLTGQGGHGGRGLGPGLFRREVTWGDEDVMNLSQQGSCLTLYSLLPPRPGHVNNVKYIKWAEGARVNWTRNIGMYIDPANRSKWEGLLSNQGVGLILAAIKVDYKFPVQFPDKISVYHKLSTKDLGTHSFALDVLILSERHQRIAARCHEDIVTYNYAGPNPGKAPIPDYMKEVFADALRLQKEAEQDAKEEMQEIEKQVEELERKVMSRAEMK